MAPELHRSLARTVVLLAVLATFAGAEASAQDPNACDLPGEFPDVIISDLFETRRLGNVGGITAFSLGTESCNLGTCWLGVFANTPQHPVFAQNMHRLAGGRFEQIGQSWAAHRFVALSQPVCSSGCLAAPASYLGVECSTEDLAVYGAGQAQLGPRFEINPVTGQFPFPATDQTVLGDDIYKRLQVHDTDLDPALHAGALYFVEGIYVAPGDAAGGNQANNASHRMALVTANAGEFDLALTGETQVGAPALTAWKDKDPEVVLKSVDAAGDGRFVVGSRATPLGGGRWHYEFAVENLTSRRAAAGFRAMLPAGVAATHVGFHDVDYHSGEPFDGTDWTPAVETGTSAGSVRWETQTFADNPNANALRWGTLYNFRFDAEVAPVQAAVELGLFLPGQPAELSVGAVVPGACDADGICDPDENACGCSEDCGTAASVELACGDGVSNDCDGLVDCADPDCCSDAVCLGLDGDADGFPSCLDCADDNPDAWNLPGESTDLVFDGDGQTLSWAAPSDPGATQVSFGLLRSHVPYDFITAATCLVVPPGDASALDPSLPPPATTYFYLVEAANGCPFGVGSPGTDSGGQLRGTRSCDR